MAAFIGGIVGGFIIVTLIAGLISLTMKRAKPIPRAGKSAAIAFVGCSILAGFGMADGGPYAWWAAFNYVIPALLAFAFLWWRFDRAWVEEDPVSVSDVFK